MATFASINLQDSASPLMEQLMYFHDHSMFIITMIVITVGYVMTSLMTNNFMDRYVMDGQHLEILWTVLPAVVLIFIALPSLRLLYLIDENTNPMLTLKTIGHQWYWSYEYSDFLDAEFDSYMIPQNEMNNFNIHLLEVDNRTTLPMNTLTRILISSEDIIHSWTIPSIGVKADAEGYSVTTRDVFSTRDRNSSRILPGFVFCNLKSTWSDRIHSDRHRNSFRDHLSFRFGDSEDKEMGV